MRRARIAAMAVSLALLAASCGGPPSSTLWPGQLVDPGSVAGEWTARQQVTARFAGGAGPRSFDAVVQKADGELTLVALTPFRTRAFSIVQRGVDDLTVEVAPGVHPDGTLPFDPRLLVLDVQRVFFVDPDAAAERVVGSERIVETWRDGALVERRHELADDPGEAGLVVRYGDDGWQPGAPPPRRIELHNTWHDYHLTIETLSWTPLDPTP